MKNAILQFITLCLLVSQAGAQNKVSVNSGNWTTPSTWSPAGAPAATDNVTIAPGTTVNINLSSSCNHLTVGALAGQRALLEVLGKANRNLTVNGNLTINVGDTFSVQKNSNGNHTFSIKGNIVNYGVLDFCPDNNSFANINFSGTGNQWIMGDGPETMFNKLIVNLGTSASNILEVTASNFSCTSADFLTLNNGTLKLSVPNTINLTAFAIPNVIPATAGLWLNSASVTVNTTSSFTLSGKVTISSGTLNVGAVQDINVASTGGTLQVDGGAMNISGKYFSQAGVVPTRYSQSGGVVKIPAIHSSDSINAPFQLTAPGGVFSMSGGSIIIQREGGRGTEHLGFTNTGSASGIVSGGTLQIGTASTPAAQTIHINSTWPIPNLVVNSANATALLAGNALDVRNHIVITTGTINANNYNITLGGSWNDAGGNFVPGNAKVTFSSSSSQSVYKSNGKTFNDLLFTGTGVKTFSSPVISVGDFSIAPGTEIDVSASNYPLEVQGNFINDGVFTARQGNVTLAGTSAQTISGSSTTTFYDLTLSNLAGALFASAANLKGTLTINEGTFNANGLLRMISDASGTARIAAISGSGDISGNLIIERYAPGGATGWVLWGTPVSSPLTIQDWDDDIYISCNGCPDGNAGFPSIYTYDETAAGYYDDAASYVPMSSVNDPLVPFMGYWIFLGNSQYTTNAITVDLTGAVNKFNIPIPLKYTANEAAADDGWNLISNPYPSPISWNALRGTTSSIDNAIYTYNPDLNGGLGGYASYVNGVSSPDVSVGGIGDIIPMSQGFYVHSTGATSLLAQESIKVAGNPSYLKSAMEPVFPLIRLQLTGMNAMTDEAVLYFQNGASAGFDDPFDAYKMRGQDPSAPCLAFEKNGDMLQVNGVPPVSGHFSIPVKALTGYNGTYTISAGDLHTFPMGACIRLYDQFTQNSTDLRTSPCVVDLSDTTSVARFSLEITILPLTVQAAMNQPSCDDPHSGRIKVTGTGQGPWNYYWTLNGTSVKTSLGISGADSLCGLTSGVYDLQVNSSGQCNNNTSHFNVIEKIAPVAQFISPDTLLTGDEIYFHNASLNAQTYLWDFGDNSGTSNLTSPVYNYQLPGIYIVNLVATNPTGCVDTESTTINVLPPSVAGVQNLSTGAGMRIVKTLGNNQFMIEQRLQSISSLSFTLYNSSGMLVQDYGKYTSDSIDLSMDLRSLPGGVYYLKIKPVLTSDESTANTRPEFVKLVVW